MWLGKRMRFLLVSFLWSTSPVWAARAQTTEVNVDQLDEAGNVRSSGELDVGAAAAAPCVVINSFPIPASGATAGLAWDGQFLWAITTTAGFGGGTQNALFRLDGSTGSILTTIPYSGIAAAGDLAWDGTHFRVSDTLDDRIYRLSADGTVVDSFPSPGGGPFGVTFDGTFLWITDFLSHTIDKVNASTGAVVDSLAHPDTRSAGLGWDGNSLWTNGRDSALTYEIDPIGGIVLSTCNTPPGPGSNNGQGVAANSQFVWVANFESRTIFQISNGSTPPCGNGMIDVGEDCDDGNTVDGDGCSSTCTVEFGVTFEWVTVGNPGNAADPLNEGNIPGIGSVPNEFRIAKHEVTNGQYAEFLNAVAATDTNGLYNPNIGLDPRGGITQSGSSGSFTYTVKTNMGNKPVNRVSFFDAMRFVNWLHNGQPTGAQDASTTEDGVYAISDGVSETRGLGARFFIPTENEWYKAAYHQPSGAGGDTDDYWLFPNASNLRPTIATANATGDISNPGANVANYNGGADWNGQDGNVTTVGSAGVVGTDSQSFYGTSDQGGNVSEWNETVASGSFRVRRGSSWGGAEDRLRSSFRINFNPLNEFELLGFRVASPVPSVCGNSVIENGEECDDGAVADGDGCSSTCAVESGYTCDASEPSFCTDDNECTLGTDNCDVNATCSNTPGSFTCTCNTGYSDTEVPCGVVTFEWVTVGNTGNAADPEGNIPGIGSVAYEYGIAKHEVTNDQYAEFLNAVAATDTNGLHFPSMESDLRGGITQSGSSGSLTYAVKVNMGNKPVNYVSFFDTMRFVNWLHNGQPTGSQDASTTEDGVYAISDGFSETRASNAKFFVPTENEWYKAAYHQPSADGGDSDDYWRYATASNNIPTEATAVDTVGPTRGDIANPGMNVVNYSFGAVWNSSTGNPTTVGSAGALSESYYGTSDQAGNLHEWTEALFPAASRVILGGAANTIEPGVRSSSRPVLHVANQGSLIGFRVASSVSTVCGEGVTCTDDDECVLGAHNCDVNATCSNTPGSFTCACDAGYFGDGVLCTDVDECALGIHNCDVNATCTNTPGSFTCTCRSGYSGDGAACTAICGDGLVVTEEQCDDNNTLDGDCCSATCQFETAGSECIDDGNVCTDSQCNGFGVCEVRSLPSPAEPDMILDAPGNPVVSTKNRYLSFRAGELGRTQAVRVTFRDLPGVHSVLNNTVMWVGTVSDVSELGGKDDSTPPTFKAATLECTPTFLDWSAIGTVHVSHEAVVPGGIYDIQLVDLACDAANEASFSVPLTLTQARWADVGGPFSGGLWTAPDGTVSVTFDVVATLDKFSNRPGAPIKARADIEPGIPDRKVNITDVTRGLDAFSGQTFPFAPTNVEPCP